MLFKESQVVLPDTQRDPLAAWTVLNQVRWSFDAPALGIELAMPSRPKPHHASWNLSLHPVRGKLRLKLLPMVSKLNIFVALCWLWYPYPMSCRCSWSVRVNVQVTLQSSTNKDIYTNNLANSDKSSRMFKEKIFTVASSSLLTSDLSLWYRCKISVQLWSLK